MIRNIFLFIILVSFKFLRGQDIPKSFERLSGWKTYPVPLDSMVLDTYARNDSEWTAVKRDSEIYVINTSSPSVRYSILPDTLPISLKNAVLKNEKYDIAGIKQVVSVDDGYLIGVNRGEFGGYIMWYSKDGKKKYKISNDQVIEFIRKDDEILAIQGLAHLRLSQGSIIKLRKYKDSRWTAFTYHTLPYAPIGIGINSCNHLIIATTYSLLEIDDTERYKTLVDYAFWDKYDYLYPTSLLVDSDVAYVGMRAGVFKMDLKTGKKEWLMKD